MKRSKLEVKKMLSHRQIHVYNADDESCEYMVRDYFTTQMAKEPEFFDFKKYYSYMAICLFMLVNMIVTESKWWGILYSAVMCMNIFLWIIAYYDALKRYEGNYPL